MVQGACLVVAVDDDHHLLGAEHGAYAHGQGRLGHLVHIVVEEAGVGDDGVRGQRLLARAAAQGRARLVEGDVPVGTDAAHEEVYPAVGLDFLLKAGALGIQVGGVAVQDVGILGLDVDVAEEVVPHEGVVALGVLLGQAHILVHVEGDYVLEGNDALLVQVDQLLVHAQGRRACGASQHEGFFRRRIGGLDLGSHVMGCPLGCGLIIRFDNYSHNLCILKVNGFEKNCRNCRCPHGDFSPGLSSGGRPWRVPAAGPVPAPAGSWPASSPRGRPPARTCPSRPARACA